MFAVRSMSSQRPIGVLLGGSGHPRPKELQVRPLAALLKVDSGACQHPHRLEKEDLPEPCGCGARSC